MIICIEGGDAAGKATQSRRLARALNAELFTFPDYATPAGKAILGNLKRDWNVGEYAGAGVLHHSALEPRRHDLLNAMVLQALMATNRLERGADLRTAAARGHVVLDRYDASGIVYGGLDGLDPAWVAGVNAQLPVRPDLYILIDVPVDEGFRRRPERRDRYEADREYLERVRIAYLRLFKERQAARTVGGPPGARWRVVDGLGTEDEVAARIAAAALDGVQKTS
jgi:dTMP kinase